MGFRCLACKVWGLGLKVQSVGASLAIEQETLAQAKLASSRSQLYAPA